MSLYVRLQLSFWNHRKTLRLRAAIGDAALWIPPRLWSYAAANQPDGDFSDYTPEEIAMLLEYSGNANAMLEAMLKAGFMDEGPRIHDWPEHNAYHSGFRERAKVAANARWEKARAKKERVQEKRVQERKGKEPSIASSMLGASEGFEIPFNTPQFQAAWDDWRRHRKEIKKPITPTSAKSQLRQMADWGESRAINAINHTISKGWQGLVEPLDNRNGSSKTDEPAPKGVNVW